MAIACGLIVPWWADVARSQQVQPQDVARGPNGPADLSAGNEPARRNSFTPGKSIAVENKIVIPIPLTANEREAALEGIDNHVALDVARLKDRLQKILPDELAILSKTTGWQPENQNALLVAVRNVDPAAVFEAWTQGNPQDAAGAEIAARQTDVRRCFNKLEQDVKNDGAYLHDLANLNDAIAKIGTSTPGINEAMNVLASLNTWGEVRKLVETAVPGNGPTAKLPAGKVPLIFDPELAVGRVIVLGNGSVLIGNQGRGPLEIRQGVATEALDLPVVSGTSLPEAEGAEMVAGILLVNPRVSRGTVNYVLNGNRYTMEPGFAQRLPEGANWTIEYDRGGGHGMASYTVTPGTYFFKQTDDGWQLYHERFDVVIDNSQSKQEFHFVFHGQNMTVPAGGTQTVSGIYPLVVRYDRGNGTDQAAKTMYFSGNVEVGVNSADNLWDLFPTNENQREVTKLKLFQ
jgi:hypothetical protein